MRQRVLSGMRPTGALHLGHYHGALKNWVRLQQDYDCFYFVADWHALTTHYEEREVIGRSVYDMVIDWLAAGLDPERSTIFIQSRLPEHAELFTLLARKCFVDEIYEASLIRFNAWAFTFPAELRRSFRPRS